MVTQVQVQNQHQYPVCDGCQSEIISVLPNESAPWRVVVFSPGSEVGATTNFCGSCVVELVTKSNVKLYPLEREKKDGNQEQSGKV